jgi:hypothetical protein
MAGWLGKNDINLGQAIDIREYIDCSLAQPACFVLVE